MNKVKLLMPLILACVLAGQLGLTHADDEDIVPHLGVTPTTQPLTAGKRGSVYFDVYNSGTYDVYEAEAILTSTSPSISVLKPQAVFNTIPYKSHAYFNASLMVDQMAAVGSYQLTFSLSYLRLGKPVTIAVPVTLFVNHAFQPMLDISTLGTVLKGGEVTNVTLVARNISSEAVTDVDLTTSTSSPFLVTLNSTRYHANLIEAKGSLYLPCKIQTLQNTPIGAYQLSVNMYYTNSAGARLRQSGTLSYEVTSPIILESPALTVTDVQSPTVTPGQQFSVSVDVLCSGAGVYNAKATLSLDPRGMLSPLSPTSVSLGDMKPGDKRTLRFDLLLDGSATAGTLPMTLSMRYMDSKAVQGSASEVITVPVDEISNFGLLEDTVASAEVGKSSTLEADLLLTGTSRLDFVRIEVLSDGPVTQVEGSRQYVGAVDTDSPVPFSLKYAVANGTAEGTYSLNLKVTWVNYRNLPMEQTLTLPLSITKPASVVITPVDEGFWGWLKRILGIQ